MNRKLLIIQLITAFLLVLIAVFINFLTNDKSVNEWLLEKGIGAKTLIATVFVITVLILVFEYFKFRNQASNEPIKSKNSITQNQRSGDNSQNYQAGGDINIVHQKLPNEQQNNIDISIETIVEPIENPQAIQFWAKLKVTNNASKSVNLTPKIQLDSEQEEIPLDTELYLHPTEPKVLNVATFRGGKGQVVKGDEPIDLCFHSQNFAKSHLSRDKFNQMNIVFRGNDLPPHSERFVLFVGEQNELHFEKIQQDFRLTDSKYNEKKLEQANPDKLEDGCIEILKLFVRKELNWAYKQEIEDSFPNLNKLKIERYLNILESKGLLEKTFEKKVIPIYELTQRGVEWLSENYLL